MTRPFSSQMRTGFVETGEVLTIIPIPAFLDLPTQPILTLDQYNLSLQPHTHVFWARTATKRVHFPSK